MPRITDRIASLLLAGLYGVAGALWIFYSDRFLAAISRDPDQLTRYQTWKGWGYVLLSTLLVLGLIRLAQRHRTSREVEAQRINALLSLRNRTGQAIVRMRGTPGVIEEVCRAAADPGGYALVWIARIEPGSGKLTLLSQAGLELPLNKAVGEFPDARAGAPAALQAELLAGRSFVCNDLQAAPFPSAWRSLVLDHGLHSVLALPVKPFERVEAAIVFHASATGRFDEHEIALLEEVARDLAFTLAYATQETQRDLAELARHETEARFRATFEQAAVGLAHVAPDGRWLRVNQKLCEIVGYDREELLRLSFQDIAHPEDLNLDLDLVERLLHGQADTYNIEKRYLRKDGGTIWINLTVSAVRDAAGLPEYFIAVIENIQSRRESEDQARLFRRLLDNVRDGIYVYRPDSTIAMDVNETACRMLGYTRAELCQMDVTQFADFRPDELHWSQYIDQVRRDGHSLFEDRHVRKDGRSLPVEVSVSLVHASGAPYLVTVIRDITERKQAERALRESEARLRTIFDTIADAIVQVDPERRIVLVNPAFTRLFGYQPNEALGRTTAFLYADPAGFAEVGRRYGMDGDGARADAGHGSAPFRMEYRRKDGSTFWAESAGAAIQDADGAISGFLALHRDVSERRAAELALQQSEERFRTLVEQAADAFFVHDGDGRLVDLNRLACDSLGYTRNELLQMNVADVECDFAADEARDIWRNLSTGQAVRAHGRHRRKDGSVFPVEINVSACQLGGRRLYLALVRDITDRVRADEAIRTLNAELENRVAERTAELQAANAELDSFAYAVSHDLRAPLRAMNGFSRALAEDCTDALDEQGHVYLDQIVRASRHMGDLIDGLLQLSRHTRGVLRRDDVDISAIARRVLAECEQIEPQRRVTWDVASGITVRGDRRMLEAVMRNLLGNAWKYTANVAQARIRVYTEEQDGEQYVRVADNGAGFDMAHSGKLFLPFQRLHRQDEFPGLGIGLATVQRIIHRHGGKLRAYGERDNGAVFGFCLPQGADTGQEDA